MKAFIYSVLIIVLLIQCAKPKNNVDAHLHHNAVSTQPDSVLMLNDSQIRLANITTQKIASTKIGQTLAINAKFVVDQDQSEVVSSRAAGRIEKIMVKETGKAIRKGEPLYELYSETLLTLQQEFLLAKAQYESMSKDDTRYKSYFKSSEKKLLLYGLTQKQIDQLAYSKVVQQRITFLAPANGIVTEINVAEGQYITEGGLLYRIENISKLWVEAELYNQEISLVKAGDQITVRVDEANTIEAKVIFLSPEYREGTQIVVLRAAIHNADMKWKPGMQAQVILTHSTKQAIAIPIDGVVRSQKGAKVFVMSAKNTFESRDVKTGLEDFRQIEITEGLKEGETVAVSGAYLLYSEFILNHD